MIILTIVILLGFFVAWNLGANDVANSMGTVVGSKALSLKQALIVAAILELSGAVLFGQEVTKTLGLDIIQFDGNPDPTMIVKQMAAVLLSCGIWLQVATLLGWPVASSHVVVGAIAGVTLGAVNWNTLGVISLGWILTPLASALVASLLYKAIATIVHHYGTKIRFLFMGLGLLVTGIFLTILAPRVFHSSLAITFGFGCVGTMIIVGVIDQNFRTHDTIELEPTFAKLQIVSACFVAFAHGSNDVGNAIAPLAVIINARHLDQFTIPIWLLLLGGLGLVAGLAVQGKKVITTVGEKIIAIKPSQGFAAELSTATVILVASRFGFPVSTSHALVGAVAGIGFTQTDQSDQSVDGNVLKGVLGAWAITLPVGFIGANLIYKLLNVFW